MNFNTHAEEVNSILEELSCIVDYESYEDENDNYEATKKILSDNFNKYIADLGITHSDIISEYLDCIGYAIKEHGVGEILSCENEYSGLFLLVTYLHNAYSHGKITLEHAKLCGMHARLRHISDYKNDYLFKALLINRGIYCC